MKDSNEQRIQNQFGAFCTTVLENEARRSFLERLRKELDLDKMVCEMEGIEIKPFISAIRAVLREYDTPKRKQDDNQQTLFDFGLERLA